jgi:chromate transporter
MIYLQLFWEYFKTGLFSFGGGMATIPFLTDMAERTGWFTRAALADMIAVSESTPGPIGVNMATYVGFTVAGVPGSIVATLGLALPSFLVIMAVSVFLKTFHENRWVQRALYGIRPASSGLIADACVTMLLLSVVHLDAFRGSGALADLVQLPTLALFAVVWVLTNLVKPTKKLHPLVFLLLGAVAGVAFRFAGA